jgi:uncharacterized metal-binding protein
MASGRTHDLITLWTLPLVVLATFHLTLHLALTAVVGAGFLLGGLMFGPDLDIHSVQYKRWGWLRWIWLPYRGCMRHRSRWSHGPLLGTAVRVLYFSGWLALGGIIVVDLLNSLEHTALTWGDLEAGLRWGTQTYWLYWLALVVGLELGACSHYTVDWLTSRHRRGRAGHQQKNAKPVPSKKMPR